MRYFVDVQVLGQRKKFCNANNNNCNHRVEIATKSNV